MAASRPAQSRRSRRGRRPVERAQRGPAGLGWSCALIFLVGLALIGLGAWGLVRDIRHGSAALGLGTLIVVGALLIVFAALLPWLADGPIRIGPLVVTLQIRSRPSRRRPRRTPRR